MTPFFQTGPEGTTIHLPPIPTGLGALLWLAGFGVVLFVLLTGLRAAPRLWRHLNAAPDHPGGLGAWLGWPRTIDSRTAPALGRVLGAGLLAVAAVTLAWLLVDFFAALARPDGHDDVRNIGLTIAALIGFPLLIWRAIVAQQQARTGQENLITGLINKAVEGLGAERTVKEKGKEQTHPNIEVRIGAILQLERIAHTQAHSGTDHGARDHIRIMEILCAYIRENAPAAQAVDLNLGEWPNWPEDPSDDMLVEWDKFRSARREELQGKIAQLYQSHTPRTDIQTALTVLGRRTTAQIAIERRAVRPGQEEGYTLDLRGTCLQAADLSHLDFDRANFWGARLEGSDLSGANLELADLRGARLEGADLSKANLKQAFLREARLEGANLREARLVEAKLRLTHLEAASLWSARLERADLSLARLQGAMLGAARLDGADLERARLQFASLSGARLEGANLHRARVAGADLAMAGLRGANLMRARLEAANLGDADMERANLAGVRLSASTTFSPATLRGALLKDVDLRVLAPDGLPDRLAEAFGDASVTLPPSLDLQAGDGALAHWSRDTLGAAAFRPAWDAYLRAIGDEPPA